MPKSKRDKIKQSVESAITHLNNAQYQLLLAGKEYEEFHPEIYQNYCTVIATLDSFNVVVKQLLEQI